MKSRIMYFCLAALFILIIAALPLVFHFVVIPGLDPASLRYHLYRTGVLIGIIVSTAGLVVTGFFVVLGVKADSHIREIRKSAEDAKNMLDVFQRKIKRFDTLSNSYAHSLDTGLEMTITLAEIAPKSEKYRDVMVLEQTRLCYRFPMLDKERQKALLRNLAEIGEFEDIFGVQQYITDNPDEDEEIKELAKAVLEILMEKWKKEPV